MSTEVVNSKALYETSNTSGQTSPYSSSSYSLFGGANNSGKENHTSNTGNANISGEIGDSLYMEGSTDSSVPAPTFNNTNWKNDRDHEGGLDGYLGSDHEGLDSSPSSSSASGKENAGSNGGSSNLNSSEYMWSSNPTSTNTEPKTFPFTYRRLSYQETNSAGLVEGSNLAPHSASYHHQSSRSTGEYTPSSTAYVPSSTAYTPSSSVPYTPSSTTAYNPSTSTAYIPSTSNAFTPSTSTPYTPSGNPYVPSTAGSFNVEKNEYTPAPYTMDIGKKEYTPAPYSMDLSKKELDGGSSSVSSMMDMNTASMSKMNISPIPSYTPGSNDEMWMKKNNSYTGSGGEESSLVMQTGSYTAGMGDMHTGIGDDQQFPVNQPPHLWDAAYAKLLFYRNSYKLYTPRSLPKSDIIQLFTSEGCPFCLSTSVSFSDHIAILHCTYTGCKHACHLQCLLDAPPGTLLFSHDLCTSFVPPFSFYPPIDASSTLKSKRFIVELTFLHLMSNYTFLNLNVYGNGHIAGDGDEYIQVNTNHLVGHNAILPASKGRLIGRIYSEGYEGESNMFTIKGNFSLSPLYKGIEDGVKVISFLDATNGNKFSMLLKTFVPPGKSRAPTAPVYLVDLIQYNFQSAVIPSHAINAAPYQPSYGNTASQNYYNAQRVGNSTIPQAPYMDPYAGYNPSASMHRGMGGGHRGGRDFPPKYNEYGRSSSIPSPNPYYPISKGIITGSYNNAASNGSGRSLTGSLDDRNSHISTSSPAVPNEEYTLENIRDRVCVVARTQIGSKFLQQTIAANNSPASVYNGLNIDDYVDIFCEQVASEIASLISHLFGNYFVQSLFQVCNNDQRKLLLLALQPHMHLVACEKIGTYALQNIISCLSTDEHAVIVNDGLSAYCKDLIFNDHGTHVIQRCQQSFSIENLKFIYNVLLDHCLEIATHQHGIVVLRNCIERFAPEDQTELAEIITENCIYLAKNAFGNYAVQHLLRGVAGVDVSNTVFDRLLGNFVSLSQLKFSSNVVERCLQFTGDRRNLLLNELFHPTSLEVLLGDIYGNYVIQTALKGANAEERKYFATLIRPLLSVLKKDGPSVYSKWDAMIDRLEGDSSASSKWKNNYANNMANRTGGRR